MLHAACGICVLTHVTVPSPLSSPVALSRYSQILAFFVFLSILTMPIEPKYSATSAGGSSRRQQAQQACVLMRSRRLRPPTRVRAAVEEQANQRKWVMLMPRLHAGGGAWGACRSVGAPELQMEPQTGGCAYGLWDGNAMAENRCDDDFSRCTMSTC